MLWDWSHSKFFWFQVQWLNYFCYIYKKFSSSKSNSLVNRSKTVKWCKGCLLVSFGVELNVIYSKIEIWCRILINNTKRDYDSLKHTTLNDWLCANTFLLFSRGLIAHEDCFRKELIISSFIMQLISIVLNFNQFWEILQTKKRDEFYIVSYPWAMNQILILASMIQKKNVKALSNLYSNGPT